MIQVNELRIGNYVYNTSYKQFCKIIRLDYDSDLFNTSPIELTKEILLKCGFEKEKEYLNKYYVIQGMLIWKCEDMFLCDKNGVHIKYLHQLQNLYFALTQKELEINL